MLKREKTGLAAAMLRYIGAFVYLASGTFTAQPRTPSGQHDQRDATLARH